VITVQTVIPDREIYDKTSAVTFCVVSFLWDFSFHFGPVFKTINLE
jgi:hypothetical protein